MKYFFCVENNKNLFLNLRQSHSKEDIPGISHLEKNSFPKISKFDNFLVPDCLIEVAQEGQKSFLVQHICTF